MISKIYSFGVCQMYAAKLRYLASIFVDAGSITSSTHNIAEVSRALGDENFLPFVFEEISISQGQSSRIGFRTASGEWQLYLFHNRFNLSHHPTDPEGKNLGDFSSFCQKAGTKLSAILSVFRKRAHRLAVVQEGLLPEMSPMEMEAVPRRLFHLPPTFIEIPPFEWDWRAASRIPRQIRDLTEQTNTIATIKRQYGNIRRQGNITSNEEEDNSTPIPFDRVRVDIDINTSQDNVIDRFEEDHVQEFFNISPAWHAAFSAELFSFILRR
jgi:hypothetical protein